jgi:hypothetical protein
MELGSIFLLVSLIPGLFQTWNSKKPRFEKLNGLNLDLKKLNSRSELELSIKTIFN